MLIDITVMIALALVFAAGLLMGIAATANRYADWARAERERWLRWHESAHWHGPSVPREHKGA